MSHDLPDPPANPTSNARFEEIIGARVSRRRVLQHGLGAAALSFLGGSAGLLRSRAEAKSGLLGFTPVPVSSADMVIVPLGYAVDVVYAWGDPISTGPAWKPDAGNTAAEQEQQAGMHHDGMHFFPIPAGSSSSTRGLLVVNHEYTDDGLLHPDGMESWTAAKVDKAMAAHGVSVVEIALTNGKWVVVRPSPYARRITARTPMTLTGPAAGHPWLKTAADPSGRLAVGTVNNCAHGVTPWGTYLTCEENFNDYFVNASGAVSPLQKRYGIGRGRGYRWHEHEARFDAAAHPNEPNRFGWVVEIDPWNPQSQPVKRTALGRIKHEGAKVELAADGRVVVYMGDDERFEYIYKFVSRDRYDPADRAANLRLLDDGTLYVARFRADGSGEWLELAPGRNGLDGASGFNSQAEVLINARGAADKAGATPMDRPEWIAVHPTTREVFCSLTNNMRRGEAGAPAADAANPRSPNVYGHIVRWREQGRDPAALGFEWDIFALAGDPANPDPARRGNIKGDMFGSPDGLWVDQRGVLWIEMDVATNLLHKGDYARMGNNAMLAADPATGEVRRFLVGPNGCEITGIVSTPDGTSLFVNIQHPGETASERTDPSKPTGVSSWPDGTRPRSATIVIRKLDGGVIGT